MNPIETIRPHLSELGETYKVKKIGVFGSFARGEENEDSDVDLLVEFLEPVSLFAFVELKETLEKILHRKVDLVTEKAVKPRIRERILKEVVDI